MAIIDTNGLEPFAELIKEIYGDIAKPGVIQVGIALATIVGLLNTCLSPIKLLNEKTELNRQKNLEKLANRFSEIPLEDIVEVPPEIAVPIAEKLVYISNEELRDLYIELLAKASTKDLNDKAHPSFINIINNLSPDEALLIEYFKKYSIITPQHFFKKNIRKSEVFQLYLNEQKNFIKLHFPKNLSGYLENFEGLGIIYITESNTAQVQMFEEFDRKINRALTNSGIKTSFGSLSLLSNTNLRQQRQSLYVTNYGKLFMDAVIR